MLLEDLANTIKSIVTGQKVVSPVPQDQVLTDPLRQYVAQQRAQSGMSSLNQTPITPTPQQGIFHAAMAALNPNEKQKTNAQQPAQTTPTPTPSPNPNPTPTPFEKNVQDGYVMSTPEKYVPIISQAAKANNVPTSLLSAMLARESMRFNPDVISGKMSSPVGAQGIAQFMPDTAKGMGINPLDVNQAINGAAKLLRAHYEQFGNRPDLGLAAYNAGPGAVVQYGGVPPYKETQDYVKGIMQDAQTTYAGN